MTAPGLLDHLADFVRALRSAGIPVGVSEGIDAGAVLGTVDILQREQLRAGLACVLVKRVVHRSNFDALFDLWWPALLGEGVSARDAEEASPLGGTPQEDIEALRNELARLLLEGDGEALRRFAREAVSRLGQADAVPGRQSFFSYRVLRALSPDTLVSRLLDALLAGSDRGGLAEQVARQIIRERIAALRKAIEEEVRRRVAADRGPNSVARTSIRPLADQVEFLRAQQQDLAALRRTVAPLARRLAARLAAKRRHGRSGRLDFRRTVRSSLATGGVPIVTHHRPYRPHKPELVMLCDVSGSVAGFSHFTLMLTSALREQFSRVRAFAFVDGCDEVTRFFTPGADLVDATQRLSREADLVWFDGHSDYGHAFEVFAERWPEVVGPKTSLLVLGDARTNYRSPGAATLKALVARSRHAYWLNPEPRRQWGGGDSAADVYAEVIEMVECRNAEQLGAFVTRLLPV